MRAERFLEELPRLFEDFPRSEHPRDRRFQRVVDEVQNLASENVLALINLAASLVEPDEAYVEIGVFHGASLIAAMLGMPGETETLTARLGAPMKANDQRQEYARGTLERARDGTLVATPFPTQDSSMLKLLQRAQCLIVRPPFAAAAAEGAEVEIVPLDF